jgi:putative membrane protein
MKRVFGGTIAFIVLAGLSASANDSEILQTLKTANEGEVVEGELAQNKADSLQVKNFAKEMVEHHNQSNTQLDNISVENKITGQESAKSKSLAKESKLTVSKLKSLTGKPFDKAYIDAQVKEHQVVLNTLNDLIPKAENSSLKTALEETRPTVEAHLKKAKQIQTALQ